jgi:hypothetical protein
MDAATILQQRADPGLPVVSIALIGQKGRQAFAALASSGARTPKDWEGKTVGYKGTPPPDLYVLLSRKCTKVRTFLFLPRRVLPSYLTGVTFPTTAGMVPDAAPPLPVGLATGRAVSVASRAHYYTLSRSISQARVHLLGCIASVWDQRSLLVWRREGARSHPLACRSMPALPTGRRTLSKRRRTSNVISGINLG